MTKTVKELFGEVKLGKRLIRNLLAERKEILELCDLLKRGEVVRVDGGEVNS